MLTNFQYADSESLAVDSAGSLYMADRDGCRVRKLSGGKVSTVAGTGIAGYSGDNGPATSAQLLAPAGIAFDSAGAPYIADSGNLRIRRVFNGVITTVAGNGTLGDGGNYGPATAAQLSGPEAVALDSLDNLYIADYGYSYVRKVSGGVITTIAGNGTDGFSGDNGPATAGQLEPIGIAVDSAGTVYIADFFNERVRALTPSGPSCSASVKLTSQPAAEGGSVSVAVQSGSSCVWAVQSLPPWITYTGNILGSGTATITLTVAPNPGATRTGTVSAHRHSGLLDPSRHHPCD